MARVIFPGNSSVKARAFRRASGSWQVQDSDKMTAMNMGKSFFEPSDFATFLSQRAAVDVGPVRVPTPLENPAVLVALLLVFIPGILGAWKIYNSSWIGHPIIWTTLVLMMFMFATSGVFRDLLRSRKFVFNEICSCSMRVRNAVIRQSADPADHAYRSIPKGRPSMHIARFLRCPSRSKITSFLLLAAQST
jgi:hypothetical protein